MIGQRRRRRRRRRNRGMRGEIAPIRERNGPERYVPYNALRRAVQIQREPNVADINPLAAAVPNPQLRRNANEIIQLLNPGNDMPRLRAENQGRNKKNF